MRALEAEARLRDYNKDAEKKPEKLLPSAFAAFDEVRDGQISDPACDSSSQHYLRFAS